MLTSSVRVILNVGMNMMKITEILYLKYLRKKATKALNYVVVFGFLLPIQ